MFALLQKLTQSGENTAKRRGPFFAQPARLPMRRRHRPASAGFTLIEIMIVVLLIGILLAIAAPNFAKAREQTRRKSCVGNLRQIQYAKDAFLMDRNLPNTEVPTEADLYGPTNYIKVRPTCPALGVYTINAGNADPTCSYNALGVTHTVNGP